MGSISLLNTLNIMGDITEYYFDHELERLARDYHGQHNAYAWLKTKYKLGTLYWLTKDNRQILVKGMTDLHLKNTINMLKRSTSDEKVTQAWIKILEKEQSKRDEIDNILRTL